MTGGGGEAQLRRIGGLDDAGIDLAEAALVLASLTGRASPSSATATT